MLSEEITKRVNEIRAMPKEVRDLMLIAQIKNLHIAAVNLESEFESFTKEMNVFRMLVMGCMSNDETKENENHEG
jgi:hypothetical protein